MEFHVSRKARDHYHLDETLFSYDGHIIFANLHASRVFAHNINQARDLIHHPEETVRSGQIAALGLMDEISHHCFALFRERKNQRVLNQALLIMEKQFGKTRMDILFQTFISEFPPLAVYKNQINPGEYLRGKSGGISNRVLMLEELIMVWLTNKNPASAPFEELLSDKKLFSDTIYPVVMDKLQEFFTRQPRFGADNQTLLEMLRAPATLVPYSLEGQLNYIRNHWTDLLGDLLLKLLKILDLLKEESKLGVLGPGPSLIPLYSSSELEIDSERFSPDKDWMPRVVLLAKNVYVWLEQLSKKYQKNIHLLDQIPDEELELLARRGFSGLWLIGVWERSKASATIKHLCGNPNAISSAYSLYSYDISSELGGEQAFQDLNRRASSHGIHLASDMVPNHMGIDSSWVTDHPERFLSLSESPYPSHSFTGPNLSIHPNLGIQIEDHYFNQSDAAVEFKRTDYNTGHAIFIYHGNDGTSMPWNDTAQLNYLNPETREAIIQTILQVARKFSIIRFDAAMTLTKKHYQRLWFPEPGSGGAIPSRSEHGMSKEEFNRAMPNEFWREVVDRVVKEVPDTLLLAEAFWLMEGYFVRALGMHRVYNSAFMNMLRNEDNASYRTLIKNTLEFDPEILKRFVNFMNNPDERTAAEQFGKGDKYFGICTLMATLPGLPMFGHGQIEGFSEKYGMEFKKALWEEPIDQDLVSRHEHEIFPLLHNRALFAGVENFLLYDFYTPSGNVNEDVFAYSNSSGDEVSLVVYNNKFSETTGWLNQSTAYLEKTANEKKKIQRKNIGEGLCLVGEDDGFLIFRDQITGLQYIRSIREILEKGLNFTLHAYEYHVFVDMQQVKDDRQQTLQHLNENLNGQGVPDIHEARRTLHLESFLHPLREIFNPGYFNYLLEHSHSIERPLNLSRDFLNEVEKKANALIDGAAKLTHIAPNPNLAFEIRYQMESILSFTDFENQFSLPNSIKLKSSIATIKESLNGNPRQWLILFSWVFLHNLGETRTPENHQEQTLDWMDEWQISKTLRDLFKDLGVPDNETWSMINLLKVLICQKNWFEHLKELSLSEMMEFWLKNPEIQIHLRVNYYDSKLWFNKEGLDDFLFWMYLLAILTPANLNLSVNSKIENTLKVNLVIATIKSAAKKSNFIVPTLLSLLKKNLPRLFEKSRQ